MIEAQAAASTDAATEAEHFGSQTLTKVWHHPLIPLPFCVLDGQKLADTEKLAWVCSCININTHSATYVFVLLSVA